MYMGQYDVTPKTNKKNAEKLDTGKLGGKHHAEILVDLSGGWDTHTHTPSDNQTWQ